MQSREQRKATNEFGAFAIRNPEKTVDIEQCLYRYYI